MYLKICFWVGLQVRCVNFSGVRAFLVDVALLLCLRQFCAVVRRLCCTRNYALEEPFPFPEAEKMNPIAARNIACYQDCHRSVLAY